MKDCLTQESKGAEKNSTAEFTERFTLRLSGSTRYLRADALLCFRRLQGKQAQVGVMDDTDWRFELVSL
jgi:hypothetical protein